MSELEGWSKHICWSAPKWISARR